MNGTKLESVQCVKDLGVSVASSFKFSQQCKDAAGKVNRMLGFIHRNISFKTKDVILPLYTSLVRQHPAYAVQLGVGVAEWVPRGSGELGQGPEFDSFPQQVLIFWLSPSGLRIPTWCPYPFLEQKICIDGYRGEA